MVKVKKETKCRVCKGSLKSIWDFGELYVSTFLDKNDKGFEAPLVLSKCDDCGLMQLNHTVSLDDMYRQYWYRSGLNRSMVDDLKDIVKSIESSIKLEDGDVVVDIGTNDGTFLSLYKNRFLTRVGYDPANNLADEAKKNCDYFINDYFSSDKYPEISKAKVITAIAMFYDLPDPNKFVQDVKNILRYDGVFVIQLSDWVNTIKHTMVDNFCHEHLEYYTLIDLINLMDRNGLEIFKVEYNSVNGGSIRIYVSFPRVHILSNRFMDYVLAELNFLHSPNNSVEKFKEKVEKTKRNINKFLELRFNDKTQVYALGASTKGNSLLQMFELDSTKIHAIGEINPDKFGLKTVGTNISIIPEEEVFKYNPKLIIILPYHFKSTFNFVTRDYIKNGGMVLYPLPNPTIIYKEGRFVIESENE